MNDSFIDVEIPALPVVPISKPALLPKEPGLYFILAPAKQVLYIGQSSSIRHRLEGWHRARYIARDEYGGKEIAYLTDRVYPDLADEQFRKGVEKQLVFLFWPICNYELQTVRRIPTEIHKLYIEKKIRTFS